MQTTLTGGTLTLALACLAVLVGGAALAQEQVGAIGGVVTDTLGAALPGVTVEVRSAAGTAAATVTDRKGGYRFPTLPIGTYTVTATLDGYATSPAAEVVLQLGRTLAVDFTLPPGSTEHVLPATATTTAIDVTSAATATSIGRQRLRLLPRGRDFASVVAQAAGAGDEPMLGGISVAGASGLENRFVIDGVDVTHPAGGSQGQPQATELVDEVQAKTGGYAAEYAGAPGGVINAITRNGSNELHGSVGAIWADSSWAGPRRPEPWDGDCPTEENPGGDCLIRYEKDAGRSIEPGFTLGGPILRDRMWFFVGYQPALVDTFSLGPSETPAYRRETTIQYLSGSITGNPGSRLLYRLAVNLSDSETESTLPAEDAAAFSGFDPSFATTVPRRSASLYADYLPSPNVLLSGRAGYWMTDSRTTGIDATQRIYYHWGDFCSTLHSGDPAAQTACRGSNPLYHPAGWSTVPNSSFQRSDKDSWKRASAGVDASLYFNWTGGHVLKGGVQYERIENQVSAGEAGNLFTFRWYPPDRFCFDVCPRASLGVRRFRTEGAVEGTNVGLFLQDSWSIGSNLMVSLGVRTGQEEVPNYGAARDPSLPRNSIEFGFNDTLAPRIGFAWDATGDRTLKVYGSYGAYYDVTKLQTVREWFGGQRWIEYQWRRNDPAWLSDWPSLIAACHTSTNVPGDNPCPQLGPPDFVFDVRRPIDPRTVVDPDLQPMESRELQLGADWEALPGSVLGLRYVNRRLINAVEDVGYDVCTADEPCLPEYFIGNPGKGIVGGDPDGAGPIPRQAEAIRAYRAIELSWRRRFAGAWLLDATYTYSRLAGNYSGLANSDDLGLAAPNMSRAFDGVVYGYDSRGRLVDGALNTDRPHAIELSGAYRFGFGTSAGVLTSWRSGTPTTTVATYNGVDFFPNGRNDLGRTPSLTQTDLFLAQRLTIGGLGLELSVNVINVFDEDAVIRIHNRPWRTDVCDTRIDCDGTSDWYFGTLVPYDVNAIMGAPDDPLYRKAVAFQAPREVRLGAKLTF